MVLEIWLGCRKIKNSEVIFSDLNCYDRGSVYLSERTTTTICCTPAFMYIHIYIYIFS